MSLSTGFVSAIDANAVVYKSDTLVTDGQKKALLKTAAALEDVPEAEKDWHPGSDNMVLDLVHPSLFPLVYGRTHVMNESIEPMADATLFCSKGALMPVPQGTDLGHATLFPARKDLGYGMYSKRFQWLPCEVDVNEYGEARIRSYINNLHPEKHEHLYDAIASIISKAIPMWACTLTDLLRKEPPNIGACADAEPTHGNYAPRIQVRDMPDWERDDTVIDQRGSDVDSEDDWDCDMHYGEKVKKPEPDEQAYTARNELRNNTEPVDLRTVPGLQVIVKLANIHLSPDKPQYAGGTWHIEGQLNEHICATALYYYDNTNITQSSLAFRERVDKESFEWGTKDDFERGYEQFDYGHMELLFGVENGKSPPIQDLGSVITKEGRLLVFPNVLQHRVEPFRLADKTKPGHRKILALFLVDPYLRIPSTANVPPQQKAWLLEMLQGLDSVAKLPPEIANMISDQFDESSMNLEEAKELRLKLMAERSSFVDDLNEDYERYKFSLCEH